MSEAAPADLTVSELKAKLKDLGLPVTGTKSILVTRLEEAQTKKEEKGKKGKKGKNSASPSPPPPTAPGPSIVLQISF